ncbi:MAG: NAD(P)H-hydrate dehydratase, partial [Phycisphaerae bacterium]
MPSDVTITREIARLPEFREDVHKGEVGRIAIIGGCCGEVMMAGAPALAAMSAFRSGAGLVQMFVPEAVKVPAAVLAPHATLRTLPTELNPLFEAVQEFRADAVALGPGLGHSVGASVVAGLLAAFEGPMVVDADALNLLATVSQVDIPNPQRIIMTPHPGELRRLLASRG